MKLQSLTLLNISHQSRVAHLFVSLQLGDQQEFVEQEEINVDQLGVLW